MVSRIFCWERDKIWLFNEAKIIWILHLMSSTLGSFVSRTLKQSSLYESIEKENSLAIISGLAARSSFHLSHFGFYIVRRIVYIFIQLIVFNFRAPASVDPRMNSVKIRSPFVMFSFLPFPIVFFHKSCSMHMNAWIPFHFHHKLARTINKNNLSIRNTYALWLSVGITDTTQHSKYKKEKN